jgi:hypothetical protein
MPDSIINGGACGHHDAIYIVCMTRSGQAALVRAASGLDTLLGRTAPADGTPRRAIAQRASITAKTSV